MAERSALQGAAPAKEPGKFIAPKKKKKWLAPLIIVVVLLAAAAAFCAIMLGRGGAGATSTYLPAQAEVRDLTVAVTGPGTIKPNDSYRATSLIRGEILTAPFEEGQTVHKDDVLFTIDAADVESAIRQAEIAVEQAKDNVARSAAAVTQAETAVIQAQAGVEQAQLSQRSAQLSYDSLVRSRNDNAKDRQVKANATGTVNKLYVDPGDTVAAGTPIADILDRDNMKLVVPFHSVDARSFYVGQSATVTVSGTAETLYGTVSELAATESVGLGGALTRNVTIVVPNPGALSPASTGTAAVNGVSCAASAPFQFNASKQLIALYSGKLETLSVREGDRVTDGQVVGEFEETSFQDQIDAALINLDNAQLAIRNAQLNVQTAQDAVSTARIALRDAQLAQQNAENTLDTTRDNLDNYTIESPIDGTVIEKNFKAGDNFDPSTASNYLAVIYDMSRLTFDISVDELDISKLTVGQSVTFTADALGSTVFTGAVEKININGTTLSGNTTYPVTVAVDGSGTALAAQGLLPGMNVSANIVIEEAGSVLCVPVEAVSRGSVVLVAGQGALDREGNLVDPSKLEERQVVLGRNDDDYIEILSGLSQGETVYIQNTSSNIMNMMMSMGG